MTARRGLSEGETFESDSEQVIYRTSKRATRGILDDGSAPVIVRAARRLLLDDTTTIRPGLRAMESAVETTFIRTKHVSMPKRRRVGVVAVLALVAAIAAVVGFSFLIPQASNSSQPPVVAAFVQPAAQTADAGNIADSVDNAADLTPAGGSAADALATDAQVKAEAAAKAQAEAEAAAAAKAKADAEAAARAGRLGTRADYSASNEAGAPTVVPNGAYIMPVKSYQLTSRFGWRVSPIYHGAEFHTGNDLALRCGTPIMAAGNGVVSVAGWSGGLGNYVEINHGDFSTGYGHQSSIVVSVGQLVTKGEVIGYVGSTGSSTGCHIHFQAINAQGRFFDSLSIVH